MYKPDGESLVVIMAFNIWLDKEYPSHSQYDFDDKGQYESWLRGLLKAYKAGMQFERAAFLAGM